MSLDFAACILLLKFNHKCFYVYLDIERMQLQTVLIKLVEKWIEYFSILYSIEKDEDKLMTKNLSSLVDICINYDVIKQSTNNYKRLFIRYLIYYSGIIRYSIQQ